MAMSIECLAIILDDFIPKSNYLKILIPLRFARIIRIMKLMKHYRAFKVLVYTIKVSVKELLLMIIFLMIGVVIFACLVYYVEPESFENIPIGCWWALVTMTTVSDSFRLTHFFFLKARALFLGRLWRLSSSGNWRLRHWLCCCHLRRFDDRFHCPNRRQQLFPLLLSCSNQGKDETKTKGNKTA